MITSGEVIQGEALTCPTCGVAVIDEESGVNPCEHVAFILDPFGEFRTISDDLKNAIDCKRKAEKEKIESEFSMADAEQEEEESKFSVVDALEDLTADLDVYAWVAYMGRDTARVTSASSTIRTQTATTMDR